MRGGRFGSGEGGMILLRWWSMSMFHALILVVIEDMETYRQPVVEKERERAGMKDR